MEIRSGEYKFIPAAPPNECLDSSSKLSFGYASKRFRTSNEGILEGTTQSETRLDHNKKQQILNTVEKV